MPPDLLVALFTCHRLARLPLLLGNTFEMSIAVLIESKVGDEECFDDPIILTHANHREILDVEVHRHRDQARIFFAFLHFFRYNVFHLGEVQGRRRFLQDELRALKFPIRITPAGFKIPAQFHRIGAPFPSGSGVHLEASEAGARAGAQVRRVQIQAECFVVEGWMIAGSWVPWLPLFACLMCSS